MYNKSSMKTNSSLVDLLPKADISFLLVYLDIEHIGQDGDTLFDPTSSNENHARSVHLRPLLGLQYIAGAACSAGIESVILDQRIIPFDERNLAIYVKERGIQLVGFYTSFAQTSTNAQFISNLKKLTDISVVVGGPGYYEYKSLLAAGADIVCISEGEETIIEIIKKVKNRDFDWRNVKGVAFLENGVAKENEKRALLDVNKIPYPVRNNFIPLSAYRDYFLPGFRSPYTGMLTSRGCPYRCSYCDSPNIWQNKVRQRSPDNVLEEIDYVVKRFDVKYIDMVDDVFGLDYNWVEEFCTKLIARNYNLHYKILVNPSTFGKKQEKTFEILAKSGCDTVGIGMQTADEDTLQFIRRKTESPQRLVEAVANAKRHGILTFVNFILGFPGEPDDVPERIMKLIDKARPTLIDCYGLLYLKGTELELMRRMNKVVDSDNYHRRFEGANKVKRHFYFSLRNLLTLFFWILFRNPTWYLFMAKNIITFHEFLFPGNTTKKSV
tara:strand:+ start:849 stop:2336 length:1488 start_codon:yes stop_codon:yes gene_type:complete